MSRNSDYSDNDMANYTDSSDGGQDNYSSHERYLEANQQPGCGMENIEETWPLRLVSSCPFARYLRGVRLALNMNMVSSMSRIWSLSRGSPCLIRYTMETLKIPPITLFHIRGVDGRTPFMAKLSTLPDLMVTLSDGKSPR